MSMSSAACRPATITIAVNGQVVTRGEPLACPHINTVVTIGLRDLLRSLLHRRAVVEVAVDDADGTHRD